MFQSSRGFGFALKALYSVAFVGWLSVSTPGYAMDFAVSEERCAAAVSVDLDSTWWSHGGKGSRVSRFQVEIPSPGVVTLDVAAPGSAPQPSLGFLDLACDLPVAGQGVVKIQRFLDRMVLAVRDPGAYVFRLAAQEPARALREYEVRTRFTPLDLSGVYGWEKDDDVIEIDPDQSRTQPFDLLSGSGAPCQRFHHLRDEVDDHSDTFSCATPAKPGDELAGEIGGKGWEIDRDVFALVLDGSDSGDLWRVELATTGETDTFGGLYDRHGQRLAMADDGGVGANFRIVKTLSPGLFFVRVEGSGRAKGPYSLAIDASPW